MNQFKQKFTKLSTTLVRAHANNELCQIQFELSVVDNKFSHSYSRYIRMSDTYALLNFNLNSSNIEFTTIGGVNFTQIS